MNVQQQHDLVVRAQAGDSQAMDALFTEYYNNVYYFALKTVKDPDLACDITQETFMEIIRTIGNLKEPAAFMTWMKQITYHQCTRHFRKKMDVLLVGDDDEEDSLFDTLADGGPVPQEILEKEEFRQTIMGMIDQLSEEQRSAVLLYYFDEMSVPQIAEIQGVSEGTVKSRLNYARKAIKKSVEGYEAKTGVKLRSVAILPLLMLYFGKELMPTAKAAQIHTAVMGSVGATGGAAAAATAATTTAATTAAATTAAATTTTTAAAVGSGAFAVKLGAGIVAAALAIGGVAVATGTIPTPWTEQETMAPTETTAETELGTETTIPTETTNPTAYIRDFLTPLKDSLGYKDVFADYPSNRVTYFVTKDGKLATRKAPHTEVDFGSNADIQQSLVVGQYPAYKDSEGVYHVHTGTQVISLPGLKGIPVMVSNQTNYCVVISLDRGQMYYSHYNTAGQPVGYDNTPIYMYDAADQGTALGNITWFAEIMNPDTGWSLRFAADEKIYKMDSFAPRIREDSAICLATATGITETDLLSSIGNPSLIYRVADRENIICVDGVELALPEGKTSADVSYAVGVQTGLVFFTDGTVYRYDQTGMVYHEELTVLNQNNAIRKVFTAYTNDKNIFLVMEDNLTYLLK